ncbi:MAG: DUF1614 domain-containing protein [Thermoplasmata archaeon]
MTIGYDIADVTAALFLVPLLWLFLFLFVWENREFARDAGFERLVFWLLVPAVILCLFTIVPLFPFSGNVIAISVGGGLIPVALSAYLFERFAPPWARSLLLYLAVFGGEAIGAFAVVVWLPGTLLPAIGVTAVGVAATLAAGVLPVEREAARPLVGMVALSSGVLVVTYLISQSIPGEGIVVAFPAYLVAPISAGALAVAASPTLFGTESSRALPLAYASTTFGVLIGADLLREPPLFSSATKGLYVIGGADFFDLVYLSGLVALAVAYLLVRYRDSPLRTVLPASRAPAPSPFGLLSEGTRAAVMGENRLAVERARDASHAAADQAQRLLGRPPVDPAHPWEGLSVPGWVVADQANLDAVARERVVNEVEAERGTQTARALVAVGRRLTVERFGSIGARAIALVIDLLLVSAPAFALWWELESGSSSLSSAVSGIPIVTAAYGFVGISFLYFVLGPVLFGTTVGKWVVGLEVCDRSGATVGGLRSMVRESPKLIELSAIGLLGPTIVAVAQGQNASLSGLPAISGTLLFVALVVFIAITVLVEAAVGIAAIYLSAEHQRIGDLWAGTWVLRVPRATRSGVASAGPVSSDAPGS